MHGHGLRAQSPLETVNVLNTLTVPIDFSCNIIFNKMLLYMQNKINLLLIALFWIWTTIPRTTRGTKLIWHFDHPWSDVPLKIIKILDIHPIPFSHRSPEGLDGWPAGVHSDHSQAIYRVNKVGDNWLLLQVLDAGLNTRPFKTGCPVFPLTKVLIRREGQLITVRLIGYCSFQTDDNLISTTFRSPSHWFPTQSSKCLPCLLLGSVPIKTCMSSE